MKIKENEQFRFLHDINRTQSLNQTENSLNENKFKDKGNKGVSVVKKTTNNNIKYLNIKKSSSNIKSNIKSNILSVIKKPQINSSISGIQVSDNNILGKNYLFENNQKKNKENSFINSLIGQNNHLLILNNSNLLSQVSEKSNSKSMILNNDKNDDIKKNKISNLTTESSIQFELTASYKNINKIAKGLYISNIKFQKATQKFVNYYSNLLIRYQKRNDKNNKKESSFDLPSFDNFSDEELVISQKSSKDNNNMRINTDNNIKELDIFKEKINQRQKETRSNPSSEHKIDEDKLLNNIIQIAKADKTNCNKLFKIKKMCSDRINKKQLISEINDIIIKSQKPLNDTDISKRINKGSVEKKKYLSFKEKKINMDNKEQMISSQNYNSNAILSSNSNINNSNYIQMGKNLLSKNKEKLEDFDKLDNDKKDDQVKYKSSSQNIINNKSNKNINEVNINFTNNFCLIY
jgi:hypothetical protein